jgi:hypothetical protein
MIYAHSSRSSVDVVGNGAHLPRTAHTTDREISRMLTFRSAAVVAGICLLTAACAFATSPSDPLQPPAEPPDFAIDGGNAISIGSDCNSINAADNDITQLIAARQRTGDEIASDELDFVGEIDLVAEHKLARRTAIDAGYQVYWIDGVAIATDQVAISTTMLRQEHIDTRGEVFYHGAFTGFDITW